MSTKKIIFFKKKTGMIMEWMTFAFFSDHEHCQTGDLLSKTRARFGGCVWCADLLDPFLLSCFLHSPHQAYAWGPILFSQAENRKLGQVVKSQPDILLPQSLQLPFWNSCIIVQGPRWQKRTRITDPEKRPRGLCLHWQSSDRTTRFSKFFPWNSILVHFLRNSPRIKRNLILS